MSPREATRRAVLRGAAAIAVAGFGGINPVAASAKEAMDPLPIPGRIANPEHYNNRVYSGLFFGGPPKPFTRDHLYTRHPTDAKRLSWIEQADIEFAVSQVTEPGLNTMKLSYFGHDREADRWAPALLFSKGRWAHEVGLPDYSEAEQIAKAWQLFHAAEKADLLVTPMLEVSEANPFYAYFPTDPAELVRRASWLLRNFGDSPAFLRVFDRTGTPRRVISLLETIRIGAVDHNVYAQAFDTAAAMLEAQLGYPVGFTIDPKPLVNYQERYEPDPVAISNTRSVVAINPFNITSRGPFATEPGRPETDPERLAYARSVLTKWAGKGVPLIADIMPGFDGHIVWKDFPEIESYGFHDGWLAAQRDLALEFGDGGVSVDYWNGFSEGSAIPPTDEDGDRHMVWLGKVVQEHRTRWR